MLVGYEHADDAGVYQLDSERALVQSLDFFTPIVDDPFLYGQIAAVNSLSDVYAMGGTPHFALSIVGFPKSELPVEVLHEILQGGTEKMNEAEVAVIGGHSVQDPELKFGYCVTGFVHPQRVFTNAGARPGDRLILTKPLGNGIITTGLKLGKTPPDVLEQAVQWMLRLNRSVRDQLQDYPVHSVTDITGYGLLGHAFEMASASDVTLVFQAGTIPVLEGVDDLAKQGALSGGVSANARYVGDAVLWEGVAETFRQVLFDPQTSGGFLISMPEPAAQQFSAVIEGNGGMARIIGHVLERGQVRIRVRAD